MADVIFLSLVGTQHMGVIHPLEACIQAGKAINLIYLCTTDKTRDYAKTIQAYCQEKNYPPVMVQDMNPARDTDIQTVLELVSGSRILFNADGGLNFAVAKMLLALKGEDVHYLVASRGKIVCSDTSHNVEEIPAPAPIPIRDILAQQGITPVETTPHTDLCALCSKTAGLRLPDNSLKNVRIGDFDFDLVWNDEDNRLSFLTNLYLEHMDNKAWLAHVRSLSRWAATRAENHQIYDRQCYVLCPTLEVKEHTAKESRGKLHAAYIPLSGLAQGGLKPKAKSALAGFFQQNAIEPKAKGSRNVTSHTLITMLGTDIAATLNAIESHPQANIILCHTPDEEMSRRAALLREQYKNSPDGRILHTLETDISGSLLPSQLKIDDAATDVHVNITPGTKGHTAFLTSWAMQHGVAIWSINPPKIVRLDSADSIPYKACDPVHLLQVQFGEVSTEDQENTALYQGLLDMFGACVKAKKPWMLKPLHVGDFALEKRAHKEWALCQGAQQIGQFTEEGGEWLEGLTAYAIRAMGASYVHMRVRMPWDEDNQEFLCSKYQKEQHRIDMDVLAAWEGSHILISCKSNPFADQETPAVEACNMAAGVSRFTLPALCHMGCSKAYFYEEKGAVALVFGWKELCQPEQLKNLFRELRNKRRTTRKG